MLFNRNFWMPLAASLLAVCLYAQTPASSGAIEVYFSHPIDEGTAGDLKPAGIGYPMMLNAMIGRINQAEQQIDVAMYNNNRSDITNALKAAQARGVRVRYIAAAAASNSALAPAPAFPVLYGNTEGLMHNKFMIIDPDLPAKTWVMTGSVNWTTTNLIADHNNLLFIQDQTLAKAYQTEFEEMWGGGGAQPSPANARFGSAKTNNTPHNFVIGGKMAQVWFSPSDGVTDQIIGALATANHSADFALFSFTKNEIGDILVDVYSDTGVPVRGMIENTSDLGCELGYLAAQGLAVYGHFPPASL
ncbi:MAG: phospholipase D-like domain-containing protein, partial [Saprospiraceae bacterium]